jgi:acylphosphatase
MAEELDVRGSVRNRSDGTVEADFEGDEQPVAEMIQWARTGPPFARVTGIEVEEADPVGSPGFRVG